MRPRLDYTPEARADLIAIAAWHTQPGAGRLARAKMARIALALAGLADHPARWPLARDGVTRVPTVAGHRVIYRFSLDDVPVVRVLRVFGPGQEQ